MPVTKEFELSNGKTVTLTRPTFKNFQRVAATVSILQEVSPEGMLENEHPIPHLGNKTPLAAFEELLRGAVTDPKAVEELFDDDYRLVFELWDAWLEHSEFDEFFTKRADLRARLASKRQEQETQAMVKQIEIYKSAGMLPENFTLEKLLSQVNDPNELTLGTLQSSLSSTPPTTDGPSSS